MCIDKTMIIKHKQACFIHSTYTKIWEDEMLLKLIDRILETKLIDSLDVVYINHIGTPLDSSKYTKIHEKIIVENYSQNINLFEVCTIRALHQFAKLHPDYNILYMHTKGVSHQKESEFLPGILSWIEFMLYSLVNQHSNCRKLLNIYDTVGCAYKNQCSYQPNPEHYSGNYWWSRADYIASLNIFDHLQQKYDAEFWLFRNEPLFFNTCTLNNFYENSYPLELYKYLVDHSFQEQIISCKMGDTGLGLCNQLYSLANSIVIGILFPGYSTIVVSDFLCDYKNGSYCIPNIIVDFQKTNQFLEPYQVKIMTRSMIDFEIISVEFGLKPNHVVDITNDIKQRFIQDKQLVIPLGTNLNEFCHNGDPLPGIRKQIYVSYVMNGRTYHTVFDEYLMLFHEPVLLDFQSLSHIPSYIRTNIRHAKQNEDLFHQVLNQIKFDPRFYQETQEFLQNMSLTQSSTQSHIPYYNVIHLRLEEDAIAFWGYINGMTPELYQSILEQKYIRLIQEHISPESMTVLLCSSTENAITEYMTTHDYKFCYMNKTKYQDREINAILDLIVGQQCQGVFIGNINPNNGNGSTFSYTIFNSLRNNTNVKKICIDTDRIFDPEYIL